MPISFSCESCTKKVKAPDGAGGKWGKCPECGHRCYVPMPASAFEGEDDLRLAPVDEKDETKFGELMKETHSLTQNILHETASLEEDGDDPNDADRRELIKQIIIYLQLIAHGELEQAQQKLQRIARFSNAAKEILKKMAKAERPEPELADVPPKLLRGFLKDLHAKLT
jgi:hypothetical protein